MARTSVAIVSLKSSQGAVITIDGRSIGAADAGREYFLEPGWHSFSATTGKVTRRERVNLARGSVRTLELTPAAPPPPPTRRDPLPAIGWGLTTMAAAAGGISIAAYVVNLDAAAAALREAEKRPGACARRDRDVVHCNAFASAQSQADTFRGVAIGSFALAGALAVGTTIYMVRDTKSAPRAVVGLGSIKVVVPW